MNIQISGDDNHFQSVSNMLIEVLKYLYQQEKQLEKENLYIESFLNTPYSAQKILVQKYLQYEGQVNKIHSQQTQNVQPQKEENIYELNQQINQVLEKAQQATQEQILKEQEDKLQKQKKEELLKPRLQQNSVGNNEIQQKVAKKAPIGPSLYSLQQKQVQEKQMQQEQEPKNNGKPSLPKCNIKNPNMIMAYGGNRKNSSSSMAKALGSNLNQKSKRSSSMRGNNSTLTSSQSSITSNSRIQQDQKISQGKQLALSQKQSNIQQNKQQICSSQNQKSLENAQAIHLPPITQQSKPDNQTQVLNVCNQQRNQNFQQLQNTEQQLQPQENIIKEKNLLFYNKQEDGASGNRKAQESQELNQNKDLIDQFYELKKSIIVKNKQCTQNLKYFAEKESKSKNRFMQKLYSHITQKKIVLKRKEHTKRCNNQEEEDEDEQDRKQEDYSNKNSFLFGQNSHANNSGGWENSQVVEEIYDSEEAGIQQIKIVSSYTQVFNNQIAHLQVINNLEAVIEIKEVMELNRTVQDRKSQLNSHVLFKEIKSNGISIEQLFMIWYFGNIFRPHMAELTKQIENTMTNVKQYQNNCQQFLKSIFSCNFKKEQKTNTSKFDQQSQGNLAYEQAQEEEQNKESDKGDSNFLQILVNVNKSNKSSLSVYVQKDKNIDIKQFGSLIKSNQKLSENVINNKRVLKSVLEVFINCSLVKLQKDIKQITDSEENIEIEDFKQCLKQLMAVKSIVDHDAKILPTVYFKNMIQEYLNNRRN